MSLSKYQIVAMLMLYLGAAAYTPAQTFSYTGGTTNTSPVGYPSPFPCPYSGSGCTAGNGSLTGAGFTLSPTDFNLPITRVTDNSTLAADPESFQWSQGGDAQSLPMDTTDTRMVLFTAGNGAIAFSWNPVNKVGAPLYGTDHYLNTPKPWADVIWSYTQPRIAYIVSFDSVTNNAGLYQSDFTGTVTEPVGTRLLDYATCVPAIAGKSVPLGTLAVASMSVSKDDQNFLAAFGPPTQLRYVVAWNRTNGCCVWDTATGSVSGAGCSSTGTIGISDTFYIHGITLGLGGATALVSYSTCLSTCTPTISLTYFWTVNGLTVTPIPNSAAADCGHFAMGYTNFVNQCDFGASHNASTYYRIPYSDVNNAGNPPLYVLNQNVTPDDPSQDDHASWGDDNSSDTNPVCSDRTTTTTPMAPTIAYQNEIVCVQTSVYHTATVWRMAHNYTSNQSQDFEAAQGIGGVSADGKWFLWTSDWNGMLGKTDGSSNSCTLGTNCRNDVFIMALPTAILGFAASPGMRWTSGTKVQ